MYLTKIKELREARGLTVSELAEKSGLSESYINKLESGKFKDTRFDSVLYLARGLNMKPSELMNVIEP